MGHGDYSVHRSSLREVAYDSMERREIFTSTTIKNDMDPANTIRECCDSDQHPTTIPVIIAVDVTGSMGFIPEKFIKEEMTKMMGSLYASGMSDTQVLFLGIGDHEVDRYPLQVGQFEADDQLLDKWLKDIYLEGGGGGNDGESYLLAWYYGAKHTKLDSFINRGKKGFIFTIGDEKNLENFPEHSQRRIFGDNGSYKDMTSNEILKEAQEKYEVYHLNVCETYSGSTKEVQDHWKQNLKDHAIMLESYKNVASTISNIVLKGKTTPVILNEEKKEVKEDDLVL